MATKLYRFRNEVGSLVRQSYALCSYHLKHINMKPGFSIASEVSTDQRCCKCLEEPLPGGYVPYNDLPPFTAHRPTSELAAFLIDNKVLTLRQKVYNYILQSGGAIDHEISAALMMQADTARPRRRELELRGHVIDSGRTRKSPKNRDAIVWIAVPW